MTMINWIKRLFHLHEYEVEYRHQIDFFTYSNYTMIQRCKQCGKIKVDKIRL